MSFDATRAVWDARRSGTINGGSALLVALALADRMRKPQTTVRASVRQLAADTGLATGTVADTLIALREHGAIRIKQAASGRRGTTYLLACYQPDAKPPVENLGTGHKQDLRRADRTLVSRSPNSSSPDIYPRGESQVVVDIYDHLAELRLAHSVGRAHNPLLHLCRS